MSDDTHRVWVVDCHDCGWERTVSDQAEADELRAKHEGIEHDDPAWHTVERRWMDVATDGGTTTLHPCSTCGGQAESDDEQCPECQRRGVSEVDEAPL
jgi:DnaJ-class molecular chaperone